MNHPDYVERGAAPAFPAASWIAARLARRAVLAALQGVRDGALTIVEGNDRFALGSSPWEATDRATIFVHDPRFWLDLALGGSIGAGESYGLGRWSADDLPAVVRIIARNAAADRGIEGGLARLRKPLERALHRLRRNAPAASRRNIRAHYDLGNDFFALFLDPTLSYSCAVFPHDDADLETASREKIDGICRRLELSPRTSVLEIGSGWGGFALHAAGRYGCRVVTTTISPAQYEVAGRRVRDAGLADRVTVLLEDYRNLPARPGGRFDHVVSIEMIEAVGHDFLEDYFRVCGRLLAPDGTLFLQAIVIADAVYDEYRRSVDFIRKHIFPGGHLPSRGALRRAAASAAGLRIEAVHDITRHYPLTLRAWRQRLRARREEARALGYPETLLRLWDYYFAYCEGGFQAGPIGTEQIVLRAG